MSNTIQEISKRNSETFNLVVKEQNKKLEEMTLQITGLNNALSVMQERLNQQEQFIQLMRAKHLGTGPTKL